MKSSSKVWSVRWRGSLLASVVAGATLLASAAPARAADSPEAPTGPDVTIIYLNSIDNYGAADGFRGYSLGTTSCNIGTEPLNWCNDGGASGCGGGTTDEDHPVIAQNLYRLRSGRLEQIGMSWLKHGFASTNSFDPSCGPSCQTPPLFGDQLGVGCTDAYGSGLNGARPLGLRSEVHATTGAFPYPYTSISPTAVYEQRIKVAEADLDPVPTDDRYWMEGQYIAPDDASNGNGLNNASYREVQVADNGVYSLSFVGGTVREQTALFAWQAVDAGVEIANADFKSAGSPIVERFEVARRITPTGAFEGPGATWHYELVVRNVNSDRAARALRIEMPGATFSGVGFHDIDHHSGEPYDTTDWTITTTPGAVEWSTDEAFANADANALRWSTAFTFWFDVDQDPSAVVPRLELFELGCPMTAFFAFDSQLLFADSFECGTTGLWTLESP